MEVKKYRRNLRPSLESARVGDRQTSVACGHDDVFEPRE